MQLRWSKVKAGVYHAVSPWGLYAIDGSSKDDPAAYLLANLAAPRKLLVPR